MTAVTIHQADAAPGMWHSSGPGSDQPSVELLQYVLPLRVSHHNFLKVPLKDVQKQQQKKIISVIVTAD